MTKNIPYGQIVGKAIEQMKFPESPRNLYDPIRYILGLSGKRIRPVLVLLGSEVFGKKNNEKALPAALAIEYFHNFSLIHDDIMDKAPLRRGAHTVHQKWNDAIAILSGDALLVKAYQELSKCQPEKIPALLEIFNEVALEVCEGQQQDMDFEEERQVSQEGYISMIRAKTSVLLGGALKMGAIIAEADKKNQQLIYDFGVNLGIAFQLQDDILDVYGSPENFGKQVGGDILSDKKTILRIKLQQLADHQDAALIAQIDQVSDTSSKIEQMVALYSKYGIRELADALKNEYSNNAFERLELIDVPEENKKNLLALGKSLMVRTR